MITFVLLAAALLALTLLAVLRPLLRQPLATPERASEASGAATPPDRALAGALGGLLLAVAVGGYLAIGNPAAIGYVRPAEPTAAEGIAAQQAFIESMVARLAERLARQPDDVDGWRKLIKSYETLRRYPQAVAAYRQLQKLLPRDADLLNDFAVTLAMSQGQQLAGEPEALIHQALAIQPDNLQSLALLGSAAFDRGDYAAAIKPWRRLLLLAPADSDAARSIAASLAEAQTLARQQASRAKP